MKKLFSIALVAIAMSACQNSTQQNDKNSTDSLNSVTSPISESDAPKVQVEEPNYNFGAVKEGVKVTHEFKFKNVGNSPLIITDASASCGCTVPEYPKAPIKPGEEGLIKVVFDSRGRLGLQDKAVTVTSNANPSFEQLRIVGEVQEDK